MSWVHPTSSSSFTELRSDNLSLDIWLGAADVLLEVQEVNGKSNIWLEEVLGILAVGAGIGRVLLNVETDGSTAGTGTGETDNNAAAIVELDVKALVLADTAIKVGVFKVTSLANNTV
jgi:hypothetical protein